jgi:hypothetical protein
VVWGESRVALSTSSSMLPPRRHVPVRGVALLVWVPRMSPGRTEQHFRGTCGCQRCHPMLLIRISTHLVASTTMWRIESNSVESGSAGSRISPGWGGYVDSPPTINHTTGCRQKLGRVPTLLGGQRAAFESWGLDRTRRGLLSRQSAAILSRGTSSDAISSCPDASGPARVLWVPKMPSGALSGTLVASLHSDGILGTNTDRKLEE